MTTFRSRLSPAATRPPAAAFVTAACLAAAALAGAACTSNVDTFGEDDGPAQCNLYEDVTTENEVAITVRNNLAEAIYLSGEGCTSHIDLGLANGQGQSFTYQRESCHFTCEELQTSDGACAADCAAPPIVMIAPGGTYALSWTGTLHDPVEMPDTCYATSDVAGDTCDQRILAPDGAYTFTATGYDDSWCGEDTDNCTCTPDENGSCKIATYTSIFGQTGRQAQGTLTLPADNTVEIVFE